MEKLNYYKIYFKKLKGVVQWMVPRMLAALPVWISQAQTLANLPEFRSPETSTR